MFASIHDGDHLGKTLKTRSFYRSQWMRPEKPDDFVQLFDSSDSELFPITMIGGDLTKPEEPLQLLKNRYIFPVLHHSKLWEDLPAQLHARLPVDPHEEASFSVDESDNPVGTQSFLLVVCTGWVFTRIEYHRILQMFQHIARCTFCHC